MLPNWIGSGAPSPSTQRGRHNGQLPVSILPVIRDVIADRVSRRELAERQSGMLRRLIAGGSFVGSLFAGETHAAAALSTLGFPELKRVYDKTHAAAEGYETTIVARWGDALVSGLPDLTSK